MSSLKSQDELEAEMRRLKLELKQTMEMYSTACEEAITANQKVPDRFLFSPNMQILRILLPCHEVDKCNL